MTDFGFIMLPLIIILIPINFGIWEIAKRLGEIRDRLPDQDAQRSRS